MTSILGESFVSFASWFLIFSRELENHADVLSLSSLQLAVVAAMANQITKALTPYGPDLVEKPRKVGDQALLRAQAEDYLVALIPLMHPLPPRLQEVLEQAYPLAAVNSKRA